MNRGDSERRTESEPVVDSDPPRPSLEFNDGARAEPFIAEFT
jgi:hypothetical protein